MFKGLNHFQSLILNPILKALNPKPKILNAKAKTQNPKPKSLNPKRPPAPVNLANQEALEMVFGKGAGIAKSTKYVAFVDFLHFDGLQRPENPKQQILNRKSKILNPKS